MAGQPVAMLVDLVADLFITGTPKRISREAPVLILSYQGEKLIPGGGANAVANVAALGGRPLPLGSWGTTPADVASSTHFKSAGCPPRASWSGPATGHPPRCASWAAASTRSSSRSSATTSRRRWTLTRRGARPLRRWPLGPAGAGGGPLGLWLWRGGAGAAPAGARPPSGPGATWSATADTAWGSSPGSTAPLRTRRRPRRSSARPLDDDPERLEEGGRRLLERLGARFLLVTRGSRGMSLFERAADR